MLSKRKTLHLQGMSIDNGESKKPSVFKGLFLGLLSGVLCSISSAMVKQMRNLHPGQLTLYRYTAMFFLCLPANVKIGQNPFGPREFRWLLVLRGVLGSTAILFMFTAFRFLSLSMASSIIFSAPIFVTIFARIFLKEPFGTFQTLTVLVTVIGIIFATKLPSQLTENPIIYSTETIYGLLAAICAAVVLGFETITIRRIKSVHEDIVMFNCCWFAILSSSFLTAVLGHFRWHYCGVQSVYIILIGFLSYVAINMLVVALQCELAGPVYTMRAASDVVLSFLWQIIIFRESPDTFGVVGAFLILLSVASLNFSKWLAHLPQDSTFRKRFEWTIN